MKSHQILNTFGRLSVWRVADILWLCLLAACGSQSSSGQQESDKPTQEVLKPMIEIRNEALATLARRFPSVALPYDTRSDSSAPAVSPLRDADLKILLRKESLFSEVYQCYPLYRLPDYGNFVSLILATLEQEGGGLRLLLVTYSPEGRPIDELLIKDSYDAGSEYKAIDTRIAADFTLEQNVLQIFYEATGEEEEMSEKDRKIHQRRYVVSPEGKIIQQP